jgi:hypothetical protein
VQLRHLALALLTLPGLVLGSGWSLRICPHELLSTDGCCQEQEAPSCCSEEAPESREPVIAGQDPCDACCIDIQTSGEPQAASVEPLPKDASPGQAATPVALHALAPPAPTHARPAPRHRPAAPPGRTTPLPLRI